MISDTVQLALVALGAGAIAAIPPTILAFAQLRSSKRVEEKAKVLVDTSHEITTKADEITTKVNGNYKDLKEDLVEAKNQIKVLTERLISSSLAIPVPSSVIPPSSTTAPQPTISDSYGNRKTDVKR